MKKALIVDLDGTLLQTNTFRDYLIFCGRAALCRFRLPLACSIVWWVALRKVRLISHSRMKRALLLRTAVFMRRRGRLDQFVEQELVKVNPRVLSFVEQYRNRGHLMVLATAAPSMYALPLTEMLHFDLCCATPLPSEVVIGKWQENAGQNKLDALQRLLRVHSATIDVVVTDHHDDLPLLNANTEGSNYIVNPSTQTTAALQKECHTAYTVLR